jgi:hypothetical protein
MIMDNLLNVGCALDWITPTVAFIHDFFFGPVSDFGIPTNPFWSRREIKRLLHGHGVHVWGLMYNFEGDVLLFTVHRRQADLTFYLLRSAGVPIVYAPAEAADSFFRSGSRGLDIPPSEFVPDFQEYQ